MTHRRIVTVVLGVLISVIAATALALVIDIPTALGTVTRIDPIWIIPAIAVLAVQTGIRATRWAGIVGTACGQRVLVQRVVDPMLAGYLLNSILPARAGEVGRTLLLARREGLRVASVAASVIIERAADVLSLLVLAIAAMAVGGGFSPLLIALGLGVVALLVGARFAWLGHKVVPGWLPSRVRAPITSFLESLSTVPPSATARATALSAFAWLCDTAVVLLAARALDLELPVAAAVLIGLGGALATAVPAAPGYIATYEVGAVTFGGFVGLAPEVVLPVALVVHLVGVGLLALAGAISLGRMGGGVRVVGLEAIDPQPGLDRPGRWTAD